MKARELTEAVDKIPQTKADYEYLEKLFDQPLPAIKAVKMMSKVLYDDSLKDEIHHKAALDPEFDCRPVLAKYIELNLPHIANQDKPNLNGTFSPNSGHPEDLNELDP